MAGSHGPLLTQTEASKNNPNWGLLGVDGATAFAGLDTQGLLLKGFEPNVQWNSLGTQSVPSGKSYTPTGVTLMAALAYNRQKVKSPPTGWQSLLSSQWKGQVGMNDPSPSGPTFPFIAGMMNYLGGVSAGEGYFTKLKANGLIIHPTNGPTLQALTSGQINLGALADRYPNELSGGEHAIDINGTTRLTGVFADVRAARGEIAGLRMDPAGCHLFPVEG
jgi:iron(III) transport system substrate-binding protein